MKNLIKSLVVLSFVFAVSAPTLAATHYCQKEKAYFMHEAELASAVDLSNSKAVIAFQKHADLVASDPDGAEVEANIRFTKFVIKCGTPEQAISMLQKQFRLEGRTINRLTAVIDRGLSCQTQPTITIQPSRPSMEELIMQQPTQPPVSNRINCTSRAMNGTVYTDCN